MGLKIAGGILIVAGGLYCLYRTGLGKKIAKQVQATGENLKYSFIDGYTEVVGVK